MPFVIAMVLVPAVPAPSGLMDTLAGDKICLQSASKCSPAMRQRQVWNPRALGLLPFLSCFEDEVDRHGLVSGDGQFLSLRAVGFVPRRDRVLTGRQVVQRKCAAVSRHRIV